jgi:hypothetical protein
MARVLIDIVSFLSALTLFLIFSTSFDLTTRHTLYSLVRLASRFTNFFSFQLQILLVVLHSLAPSPADTGRVCLLVKGKCDFSKYDSALFIIAKFAGSKKVHTKNPRTEIN